MTSLQHEQEVIGDHDPAEKATSVAAPSSRKIKKSKSSKKNSVKSDGKSSSTKNSSTNKKKSRVQSRKKSFTVFDDDEDVSSTFFDESEYDSVELPILMRRLSVESDDTRTTAAISTSNDTEDMVDINLDKSISDFGLLKQKSLRNKKKQASFKLTKMIEAKKKRGVIKDYTAQWHHEKLPEDVINQNDSIRKAMEAQKAKKGIFGFLFEL